MARTLRRIFIAAAVLAALLVVVASVGFLYLRQGPAGGALNLFADGQRADNFRTLHEALPSRPVAAGGDAWAFDRDDRPLPERYAFEGEDRSLADLLRASETTGLLVAHGGAILHEAYFQGYDERSLATSFSVAKSFTSALVGIALERGQIRSLDDAISDYVPELVGSGYEGVAIRDVLTMSSGLAFDEDYARLGSDVMRLPLRLFVLRQSVTNVLRRLQREREPGALQSYASSDAQALGLLLARATGTTVAGRLFLDAGRRDDRQVVPEAWVAASVRPGATTMAPDAAFGAGFGYGYQWWVPEGDEGDFLAMGIWGQFVYVHPGHRVVIVKTSTDPDYAGRERETVAAFRAIAAALAGGRS